MKYNSMIDVVNDLIECFGIIMAVVAIAYFIMFVFNIIEYFVN